MEMESVLKLAPVIITILSAGLHELANCDIKIPYIAMIKDDHRAHTFVTVQFFWIAFSQYWFYNNILQAISIIPMAIMHHGMWPSIYIYDQIRWAMVIMCMMITYFVW